MMQRACHLVMVAGLVCACSPGVDPAAPSQSAGGVEAAQPLEVGQSPIVEVSAPAACVAAETEVYVDGQLQGPVGAALTLQGLTPGRHILRFRLPGCETKDILIVVDPASSAQAVRVSLEPAMGTEPDAPFVYDLY